MSEKRHPGITMHQLSFGGGFIGLLFALGSALIFVLGFPTLWYFVAFAFALGVGIAILLRIVNHRVSERNKPLSILSAPEKTGTPVSTEPDKKRHFFQIHPKLSAA